MEKSKLLSGVEVVIYSVGLVFFIIAIIAGVNASSFRFTDHEAQLGVPFGVVIAAVLAFIAQRRTARENFAIQSKTIDLQRDIASNNAREQRLLAKDQRLWDKRAKTYSGLVKAIQNFNAVTGMHQDFTKADMTLIGVEMGVIDNFLTPLMIYGDKDITQAFHAYRDNMQTFFHQGELFASLLEYPYGVMANNTPEERQAARADQYESVKNFANDTLREGVDFIEVCRDNLQADPAS